MKLLKTFVVSISSLMLAAWFSIGTAQGSDLKFTGLVTAVTQTDLINGIVEISIQTLDLSIVVNGGTEIKYHSEHLGMAGISAGDLVKIRAFFSDEGITAEEIEVLETSFQRFHLNGVITALDKLADNTFIAVSGVDVQADNSTLIVPRSDSDAGSVDLLQIGDPISVVGRLEDGNLRAKSIYSGSRIHGEIDFDGTLLAVSDGSVLVQLLQGVEVSALLTDDTKILGVLSPGAYVEVDGIFNSSLELVVQKIAVDTDGDLDADDDNSQPDDNNSNDIADTEIGSEITLQPVNSSLSGKAEIRLRDRDGRIDQKFEVEIEDSQAGITYTIIANIGGQSVNLGTLTTNSFGEASAEYEIDDNVSDRDLAPFLPTGLDVTDFNSVEILLDGVQVLTGQFDLAAIGFPSDGAGSPDDDSDDSNSGGSSDDDDDSDDSNSGGSSDDDDSDGSNSGSGSNDDDNNSGNDNGGGTNDVEVESTTILASNVNGVHGDADIRYRNRNGAVDQKFQVEIEDAPAATTYTIIVIFGSESVDFGTLLTSSLGAAEAEYEIDDDISDRPLAPYLPEGKSVLDITSVQIVRNGAVVAQGSF